jgi:hypothetical protein
MKKYIKTNQSGASAIMFAMVFIVVISLISLGFATLARRDQRAALDKNISQQAQLAAESGINSVQQYINTYGSTAKSNSNCTPSTAPLDNPGYVAPNFTSDGGPAITCLQWNLSPKTLTFTLNPFDPYSFNFETSSANNTTRIQWTSPNSPSDNNAVYSVSNKLPSVTQQAIPILKLVIANTTNIYDSNWKPQIVYLVPSASVRTIPNGVTPLDPCSLAGSINDYVDLGNACIGTNSSNIKLADGLAYFVPCDIASRTCSARIAGYHYDSGINTGNTRFSYSIMSIGNSQINLQFQSSNSFDGFGSESTLNSISGVQARVDVNVKSQDQSKRTIAYLPLQKQTWQPWFASLSDSMCKDIKVDGTNDKGVILPGSVCPN